MHLLGYIFEIITGFYVWHNGEQLLLFWLCFYIYLNVLHYDNTLFSLTLFSCLNQMSQTLTIFTIRYFLKRDTCQHASSRCAKCCDALINCLFTFSLGPNMLNLYQFYKSLLVSFHRETLPKHSPSFSYLETIGGLRYSRGKWYFREVCIRFFQSIFLHDFTQRCVWGN